MPQFWIVIFFMLLAVTELYQSVKSIELPFPVYLVLGTLLAVASNYQPKFAFGQIQTVTVQENQDTDPALSAANLPILPTAEHHPPQSDTLQIDIS